MRFVVLLSLFGGIINLVSGAAILKRKIWGRRVYFIITPIILLISIEMYGTKFLFLFLLAFIFYLLFVFLLTRPSVTEYFETTITENPQSKVNVIAKHNGTSTDGKKIFSVILLIMGGFMLTTWFMIIYLVSDNIFALMFLSLFCGGITCAFIIPAIFLWNKKKWAGITGTLLTTVGGVLLMMALMFYQFTSTEGLKEEFSKIDPMIMDQMIRGSFIFGCASAIVGGLFLLLQRENNKEDKQATEIVR